MAAGVLFLLWFMVPTPIMAFQEPTPVEENTPGEERQSEPPANDIGSQPVPDYPDERGESLPGPVGTGGMFLRTMGALILVLGAILLVLWGARKLFPQQLGAGVAGNHLRLLQSLPLGPKRYVSLIEADGRRLLVGVTETQINLIKDLNEIPFETALEDVSPRSVREMMEEE